MRDVYVSRAVAITDGIEAAVDAHLLAARTGYAEDRLLRADVLVRLTMAAVARLRDALGEAGQGTIAGAGILVGLGLATIDTNAAYLARSRALGRRGAAVCAGGRMVREASSGPPGRGFARLAAGRRGPSSAASAL